MSTRSFAASHHANRVRGLQFLGEYAATLAVAYAASVDVTGQVTIQGNHGTLRHLVALWQAIEVERDDEDWPFVQWLASSEGVELRFIEEIDPPDDESRAIEADLARQDAFYRLHARAEAQS